MRKPPANRKTANAAGLSLSLAPLWKRCLALVVDIAIGLSGIGLAAAAVLFGVERSEWFCARLEQLLDRSADTKTRWPDLSDLVLSTSPGVGFTMAVVRRNRQTYGQRLMGIRRASAIDGGPVTVKSAIIHHVACRILVVAGSQAAQPAVKRHRERLKALYPEFAAIRREHAEDPGAGIRESLKLLTAAM